MSATRLPADLTAGDLLAVAGTGAYHHIDDAGLGGPPVLGIAGGLVRTLRRRATFDEMLRGVA
jgi:diaminopimelate decarboxylase